MGTVGISVNAHGAAVLWQIRPPPPIVTPARIAQAYGPRLELGKRVDLKA